MPVVLAPAHAAPAPIFPHFKPLELEDRDTIRACLAAYQPQTSELSFTNLFMWRHHYGFCWSLYEDSLLVVSMPNGVVHYGYAPIGPAPRLEDTRTFLQWLREASPMPAAAIERADQRLVGELDGHSGFAVEATREHFDYIYRSEDLIQLAGRKYHAKRNHLNKLMRSYRFRYEPLTTQHIEACRQLTDNWCQWRRCDEDLNLVGEWDAIREALENFDALAIQGGVIVLDQKVEAFSLGELLNDRTAVVHIEKANPELPGMYALINQQFCEQCWSTVSTINREQDLGEPGLRKAKLSYFPDHLVEKYRVRLL